MKTLLAGPNAKCRTRVFLIITCIVAGTSPSSGDIIRPGRLSNAGASSAVVTPISITHATNLSTRLLAGTGNNMGIGGFIITGTGSRHLLIRGIGPSLSDIISNALPDPSLRLYGGEGGYMPSLVLTNDNWRDTQEAEIIATGRAPSNDLESAIVADLAPGAYTAILGTNADTTGVALVEIYDLSTNQDSRLANISTRANIGWGNDIVIAGFILDGAGGGDTLVVRGLGPSIDGAGINPMADPKLELRDSQGGLIASDDNWMDDPSQAVIIQAAGLAPNNNLESAIVATLMPGEYTALLFGVNNGTGTGLVEVYDNPVIGPTPTPCAQCTPTPAPTPCSQCTPTPTPPPAPFTIEAEDALLTGCYRQVDPQAANGYRVDGIDRIGDSVTFVQLPAGTHLIFRYATPYSGHMTLYINDIFTSLVDFEATPGGWVYPFEDKEVVTKIPEGSSVKLQFNSGDVAINLDYIQIY